VEKYGTARQATDDNIIRRMRFACWITKATDTDSEYVILIAFRRQQGLSERALNVTFIRTLPVLLILKQVMHVVYTNILSLNHCTYLRQF
jgi:hypothetical protein